MQIYGILQIYSILNLVVFLFISQEGEVLEKVGMRAYKNASLRKPEVKHKIYQAKTLFIRELPLHNLIEVVSLRVGDAESLTAS